MEWHQDKKWQAFKDKWRYKSGMDLNYYKPTQMHRRINNFMERSGAADYDALYEMICQDAVMYHKFLEHLTINVSEFFRTPEKFIELENYVIPELLKKSRNLKIWSAGCSFGAEPYSLAMMLNEAEACSSYRILATDLDKDMLAKARMGGPYLAHEIKNIPPERIKKYFLQTAEGYVINDEIRRKVEFKAHNLLQDIFEKDFDLILCRNVVIYFTEEAKDALYRNFYRSLKEQGVLFVGGTEAIMNFREIGYTQIRPFFYQKVTENSQQGRFYKSRYNITKENLEIKI